ncbi:MAG: hypothetical protein PHE88_11095 [Elusimicrobia bacterium]|nr:hypothetical protein [Elusimicrobiota bacterium]
MRKVLAVTGCLAFAAISCSVVYLITPAKNKCQSSGADYAEWFEKEGDCKAGDLVGLNINTGKVRNYLPGDILVGIYSENPGFVGNKPADKTDEEMKKENILVGLVGQVNVDVKQINIVGRRVETKDNRQIGYLLANGKVLLKM